MELDKGRTSHSSTGLSIWIKQIVLVVWEDFAMDYIWRASIGADNSEAETSMHNQRASKLSCPLSLVDFLVGLLVNMIPLQTSNTQIFKGYLCILPDSFWLYKEYTNCTSLPCWTVPWADLLD